MIDPAERQRRFNRMTFDNRDAAAPHRRIVTDLILEACGDVAAPRVLVLGAGNLNDVDLAPLIERGARMVVTDLDGDGLRGAVARQGYADDPRVGVAPDVDVAPLLARLASATREGSPLPDGEELATLAADVSAVGTLRPAGTEPFDVVVSNLPAVATDAGTDGHADHRASPIPGMFVGGAKRSHSLHAGPVQSGRTGLAGDRCCVVGHRAGPRGPAA